MPSVLIPEPTNISAIFITNFVVHVIAFAGFVIYATISDNRRRKRGDPHSPIEFLSRYTTPIYMSGIAAIPIVTNMLLMVGMGRWVRQTNYDETVSDPSVPAKYMSIYYLQFFERPITMTILFVYSIILFKIREIWELACTGVLVFVSYILASTISRLLSVFQLRLPLDITSVLIVAGAVYFMFWRTVRFQSRFIAMRIWLLGLVILYYLVIFTSVDMISSPSDSQVGTALGTETFAMLVDVARLGYMVYACWAAFPAKFDSTGNVVDTNDEGMQTPASRVRRSTLTGSGKSTSSTITTSTSTKLTIPDAPTRKRRTSQLTNTEGAENKDVASEFVEIHDADRDVIT
jgi:hypothetical protein